jgi:SWI/SNF-related matrix-associated actin-dependent regulator 1 of chromatin subfamily A
MTDKNGIDITKLSEDELEAEQKKLEQMLEAQNAWLKKIADTVHSLSSTKAAIQNEIERRIPAYNISLDDKFVRVKFGKRARNGLFSDLPTWVHSSKTNDYILARNEAYRLGPILVSIDEAQKDDIRITPEAKQFIEDEVRARIDLSNIRSFNDIEWVVPGFEEKGIKLHPFQRITGKFIELTKFRGLILNQMGLGKTLNSIAIVMKNQLFPALVICPSSVRPNWEREILRFTGEAALVFTGETPNDVDLIHAITKFPKFILMSYDSLAGYEDLTYEKKTKVDEDDEDTVRIIEEKRVFLWVHAINKLVKPAIVICDEAHKIKNTSSKRGEAIQALETPKFIGLTGTPIVNRPMELLPLLQKVDPENYLKVSAKEFNARYAWGKNGVNPYKIKELHDILQRYAIRYLTKDVFTQLPPITTIERFIDLPPKARKMYNKVMDGILEQIDSDGNVAQHAITGILAQLMRLKQLCTLVKMDVAADLARDIYDAGEDKPYRKVIIFSQFKSVPAPAVGRINSLLAPECVTFTGDNPPAERQFIVDQFQRNQDIHFLSCSTQAAAEGLNITAAGSVIFTDLMWTPKDHMQAIGRAYGRISDAHHVDAYYILCRDTIDDMIHGILQEKIQTIETVVDGAEASRVANGSVHKELFRKLKGIK